MATSQDFRENAEILFTLSVEVNGVEVLCDTSSTSINDLHTSGIDQMIQDELDRQYNDLPEPDAMGDGFNTERE